MTLTLPPETEYTDLELSWMDGEPRLLPMGQDSLWGQARHIFANYLQTNVLDALATYWLNLDPATCNEDDIANWEVELGIPVDTAKSLAYRRALVQIRSYRGAFTRTFRNQIIELFINAAEGRPIVYFTAGGIPFTSDGITFGSGDFDTTEVYRVEEDVPGYSYSVLILDTVDADFPGLYRELKRVTPAPIDDNFTVSSVSSLLEDHAFGRGAFGSGGFGE